MLMAHLFMPHINNSMVRAMSELPVIPAGYTPSENEEYMSPLQLAYFRQKLLDWRKELLSNTQITLDNLRHDVLRVPEAMDRIALENEQATELRTRDRMRKALGKIEKALKLIDEGEYGYCEVTGDPIGLKRLEARPVATMTVEAQEEHENYERTHRDLR